MPYDSGGVWRHVKLFDVTYRVARELGGTTEGVATGGSTTTVIDTRVLALTGADFYNQGMAWILRDSAEAGAAPEGEFGEITDDDGAGTLTVGAVSAGSGNPFTVAPATGDRYAVTTSKYPPHQLIFAVNAALQDMGTVPFTDTTTIDTASSQTEYTLPLAGSLDLREVYIQERTGDSNDNRWSKIENWYIQKTAIGTADLLVVPFQYVAGRDVKLVYMGEHPELNDAGDNVSENIHPSLLVAEAALRVLEWRDNQPGNDPSIRRQMDRFLRPGADGLNKIERLRAQHAIFAPPRQPNLLTLGRKIKVDQFTYPGP